MRFRQVADAMRITLPEEDEALKTSILSSGIVIDDKVYCKNNDMLQELQHIVDNVFSSGASIIYYESLFENEHEWMESHVITSSDMLKEYIQNNIVGCSFSKKFMVKGSRRSEKEAITVYRIGERQIKDMAVKNRTLTTRNIFLPGDSFTFIPSLLKQTGF